MSLQKSRPFFIVLYGLLITLMFLSFLRLNFTFGVELDNSWQQVLAYAYQHNLRAGVDYIFTYGPLGFLVSCAFIDAVYNSELFYLLLGWQIYSALLFTFLFLLKAAQLPRIQQIIFLGFIVTLTSFFTDSVYFLAIIVGTLLVFEPPKMLLRKKLYYFLFINLIFFNLSLFSFIKFTYLAFSLICYLSIIALFIYRKRHKELFFLVLSSFVCFYSATRIAHQSLANIPAYIKNYWEISAIYSEAMAYGYDRVEVFLALIMIFLVLAALVVSFNKKEPCLPRFLLSVIVASSLFFLWKMAFVRQDMFHTVIFFTTVMSLPFLLNKSRELKRRNEVALTTILYLNLMFGFFATFYSLRPIISSYNASNFLTEWINRVNFNVAVLSNPAHFKELNEKQLDSLKQQYRFKKISKIVGEATIDIFSPNHGLLFLDRFTNKFRPVFSYKSYSEKLNQINLEYYNSPPQFVLLKLASIDNRFTTTEDPAILRILLSEHIPIIFENGFLLLKYAPKDLVVDRPTRIEKEVAFGEKVILNQEAFSSTLLLSLDIEKSFFGKSISFLYRLPPELFIEVETFSKKIFTYRIVPSMVKSEFLLSPLLSKQKHLLQWYVNDKSLDRVRSIKIICSEGMEKYLNPKIGLRVRASNIRPYSLDKASLSKLIRSFREGGV